MEGTQTPAGEAKQTRPRRHEVSRRLGGRLRKAKCLERKSTLMFNRALQKREELSYQIELFKAYVIYMLECFLKSLLKHPQYEGLSHPQAACYSYRSYKYRS